MERLYLSITGESVTIHHRPTHEFIAVCSLKDAGRKVKELLKMSTKEFYKYLVDNVPFIRLEGKINKVYRHNESEQEDWYKKAWIQGTNKLLKQHKISMVDEDVPYEYIDILIEERHRKRVLQFSTNNILDEEEAEEKWHETESLKQPHRRLIKKSNVITPKETEEDTEEAESTAEKFLRRIKSNKHNEVTTKKKRVIKKH